MDPQSRPLADRPLTRPHPSRLTPDDPDRERILAAHAAALAVGDAGYPDPVTGLYVLTAGFLADRGTCCGRGCRHCPYVTDDDRSVVADPDDGRAIRRSAGGSARAVRCPAGDPPGDGRRDGSVGR